MKLNQLTQYKLLKNEYSASIDFERMEFYFNQFVNLFKQGFGKHFIFFKRPIFIDIGTKNFHAPIAFSLAFKMISRNDKFSDFYHYQAENPFYFIGVDKDEDCLKFAIELSKKEYLHGALDEEIWNYLVAGTDYGYINDKFSFCNTKPNSNSRDIETWSNILSLISAYTTIDYLKTRNIEVPMNWENWALSFEAFPKTLLSFLKDLERKVEFTFIINLNCDFDKQDLSSDEIATFINTLFLSYRWSKILLIINDEKKYSSTKEILSKLPDLKQLTEPESNFIILYKDDRNILDLISSNGYRIFFEENKNKKNIPL